MRCGAALVPARAYFRGGAGRAARVPWPRGAWGGGHAGEGGCAGAFELCTAWHRAWGPARQHGPTLCVAPPPAARGDPSARRRGGGGSVVGAQSQALLVAVGCFPGALCASVGRGGTGDGGRLGAHKGAGGPERRACARGAAGGGVMRGVGPQNRGVCDWEAREIRPGKCD
ncbi:MAG: hypothetical protein J3K34DRAFT_255914 [Monoraphidium minutum]|nr:MAG: hypothetical protein J3K34DRAFT_255914 [Monoraphidium minutum]